MKKKVICWHLAFLSGLVVALFGFYWDFAWHTDMGRDDFASSPHLMLYCGTALSGGVVGLWALKVYIKTKKLRAIFWEPSLALAVTGVVVTLVSAPIDHLWHEAYGRDAVAWSPPHMLGVVGLFTLSAGVLLDAGRIVTRLGRGFALFNSALVLAVLLAPVQEYESDVPQFAVVWYLPVLTAGCALAFVLTRAVSPQNWSVTKVAALYTGLRIGIVVFLKGVGFSLPIVPPVLIPAILFDLIAKTRLSPKLRATCFALAVYATYAPTLNYLIEGIALDLVDVVVGFPLAAFVSWIVLALATSPRLSLQYRPIVNFLFIATFLLLLPDKAFTHDPGQGREVGQVRMIANQQVFTTGFTAHLLDMNQCDHFKPKGLVARRAGVTLTVPLHRVADCRFQAEIRLPERGRWFVYIELINNGRGVESWLPVTAGKSSVRFEKIGSLYEPPSSSGSLVEILSGIFLYGINFALFGVTMVAFRRLNDNETPRT